MKNFGKEWTTQQDTLLKQLMDLGYSSKKIYENYGEIFGRTENSISQRMCFLRKPIEERVKKEKPKSNNDIIGKCRNKKRKKFKKAKNIYSKNYNCHRVHFAWNSRHPDN